jgi:hypothetical protein
LHDSHLFAGGRARLIGPSCHVTFDLAGDVRKGHW